MRRKMAIVRMRKIRFILGVLSMSLCVCPAFGQSKYAKVKDGVGNILIGEALPYQDDAGYKNVVLDSVKLSQMAAWKNFYFRAYLGSTIGEIDHDIRVLAWHIEGVGGRAEQFNREVGSNFVMTELRKDDSASYGERSEWASQYPDFNKPAGISLGTFIKALSTEHRMNLEGYNYTYDYSDPDTFAFRTTQDDLGDLIVFSPATFKVWKDKYGLSSLVVTMTAFSFTDGGETSEGTMTKTLVTGSDGTVREEEHLSSIRTFTVWEDKRLLATGKFTIVLD